MGSRRLVLDILLPVFNRTYWREQGRSSEPLGEFERVVFGPRREVWEDSGVKGKARW